ncbi:MAG: recombination mediator RecR [Patescibacteria group bacterium]
MYPPSIQHLIDRFTKLPGVGPKTAERFVFYLLKRGRRTVTELTDALTTLHDSARSCAVCFDFTEDDRCHICASVDRDSTTICVVADSQDVQAIERSGAFRGRYHVLRGVLEPARDIGPDDLKINELLERVKTSNPPVREIILALNPDLPGETTSLYLAKQLKAYTVRITRLGRGLPLGSDVDYADDITLTDALKGRQAL